MVIQVIHASMFVFSQPAFVNIDGQGLLQWQPLKPNAFKQTRIIFKR
jgi:hypothetical protein